jgi:hypothetical protein
MSVTDRVLSLVAVLAAGACAHPSLRPAPRSVAQTSSSQSAVTPESTSDAATLRILDVNGHVRVNDVQGRPAWDCLAFDDVVRCSEVPHAPPVGPHSLVVATHGRADRRFALDLAGDETMLIIEPDRDELFVVRVHRRDGIVAGAVSLEGRWWVHALFDVDPRWWVCGLAGLEARWPSVTRIDGEDVQSVVAATCGTRALFPAAPGGTIRASFLAAYPLDDGYYRMRAVLYLAPFEAGADGETACRNGLSDEASATQIETTFVVRDGAALRE